ncbi:MAG: molybdopterin cofactor-binding domain-containing protein, partial [Methyloligellaceae bacterium]
EGRAFDSGNPENFIVFGDLATIANPMRGAVAPGTQPGLEATSYFGPEGGTTSSGAHGLIVEVDPETLMVEIVRYVVVHDCGVEINPMIVNGQVKGGVVQGIGNAFFERIEYDDNGQLLNGTLADYLIPTSLEAPKIEVDHHTTPSTLNNLGIKGVGEAGAIPVGPLFAQAVEDALSPLSKGLEVLDIPLSPYHLWKLVEKSLKDTNAIG